jgi:hypothetical protein
VSRDLHWQYFPWWEFKVTVAASTFWMRRMDSAPFTPNRIYASFVLDTLKTSLGGVLLCDEVKRGQKMNRLAKDFKQFNQQGHGHAKTLQKRRMNG